MALREIYTDQEIYQFSNVNIRQLESEITDIVDKSMGKLALVCPEGKPKNEFLAYLAKEI